MVSADEPRETGYRWAACLREVLAEALALPVAARRERMGELLAEVALTQARKREARDRSAGLSAAGVAPPKGLTPRGQWACRLSAVVSTAGSRDGVRDRLSRQTHARAVIAPAGRLSWSVWLILGLGVSSSCGPRVKALEA